MTPVQHHPDADTLVAYASGNLAEGFALVVATHLARCAACRKLTDGFDTVGGVLLDALDPTPLATDAFAQTIARVGEQQQAAGQPRDVPHRTAAAAWWQWEPLASYLDGRPPRWWRPLGPGIGYSPIKRRGRSGASSILLRISPNAALPLHQHAGTEMNLVLEGGYSDTLGRFEVGDFSCTGIETTHKPVADPDAICITLVALAGPLLFGGAPVRWLQALAGI
jgi:putative transcriptional regulator